MPNRLAQDFLRELEATADRDDYVAEMEHRFDPDPKWVEIRTALIDALKPYPEARQAVADAIRADLGRPGR